MQQPDLGFPLDVLAEPLPRTMAEALAAIQDKAYCQSQNWQQQQMRALRSDAHPDILEFERVFVKRLPKLDIPAFAHNMVRTWEQQDKLFADGVSKAKGGASAHNFGMAVDVIHGVKAWVGMKRPHWALFGHVGKEVAKSIGVEVDWGGDWLDFYDPAHWQITGWKRFVADYPFAKYPSHAAYRADLSAARKAGSPSRG